MPATINPTRPNRDRAVVVARRLRHLERMLVAGAPLALSLRGVGQSDHDPRLIRAAGLLEDGLPLVRALEVEGALPYLALRALEDALVERRLPVALALVAQQYERQAQLDQAIREATLYPKLVSAGAVLTLAATVLALRRARRSSQG